MSETFQTVSEGKFSESGLPEMPILGNVRLHDQKERRGFTLRLLGAVFSFTTRLLGTVF